MIKTGSGTLFKEQMERAKATGRHVLTEGGEFCLKGVEQWYWRGKKGGAVIRNCQDSSPWAIL